MLQKILVPLDGSKLAEKALPYAQELAQKFDGELILLQVLHHPIIVPLDYGGAVPPVDLMMAHQDKEAKAYLMELRDKIREQKIPTRTIILESHSVADSILDVAKQENVDIIVKTTHGRTGPSRWLFGNVAAKVLQQAECPVFLIRISIEDADE